MVCCFARQIMLRAFCGSSDSIAAVASEEEDDARLCSAVMDNQVTVGDYVAVFDPIDGSKNVDSSLPVGTIFGIYKYERALASIGRDFSALLQLC